MNGSGYKSNGMYMRVDGQIEIGHDILTPAQAIVRILTVFPDDQFHECRRAILEHKRKYPYKPRVFH